MVKSARKLIGATNPLEAEPGTIRGDHAVEVRLISSLLHSSCVVKHDLHFEPRKPC